MKINTKQDIGLGINDSQPISISINLPKEETVEKPKLIIPVIEKKEEPITKELIKFPPIKDPPPKQVYGIIHNEQPVIKQEPIKEINKNSILDTVDTGFDCDHTLYLECPTPVVHKHLCVENFLSEFKTDLQKQLARDNLGVYNKEEIKEMLNNLNIDTSSFITKNEIGNYLQDLDYVKSTLKSSANYNIPETLFTL